MLNSIWYKVSVLKQWQWAPMPTRRFSVLTDKFLNVTTSDSNSSEHGRRRHVEALCMVLPFFPLF